MIDLVIGLYLLAMLVRGWFRGFVKELFDLAGLAIGLLLAFRASGPVGDFFASLFGFSPEWTRVISGILIFVGVAITLAIVSGRLSRWVRLPGLNLPNRVFGAGVAFVWGILLVALLVVVLRALPIPNTFEERLDDSRIVASVAGVEENGQNSKEPIPLLSFAPTTIDFLIGTFALEDLQTIFNGERVVLGDNDRVEIDAASLDDLSIDPVSAEEIFNLLNLTRSEYGSGQVAWSEDLSLVARNHAVEMYTEGYMGHVSDQTGGIDDRVNAIGLSLTSLGENLALASSAESAHDTLTSDEVLLENMVNGSYDQAGVAAIRGPSGLMVVEVLGGN